MNRAASTFYQINFSHSQLSALFCKHFILNIWSKLMLNFDINLDKYLTPVCTELWWVAILEMFLWVKQYFQFKWGADSFHELLKYLLFNPRTFFREFRALVLATVLQEGDLAKYLLYDILYMIYSFYNPDLFSKIF